jgi:excisionase family DNA binding protein
MKPVENIQEIVYLTIEEAAKRLNISERTFRRHVKPNIPYVRIGGSIRYDVADLTQWVTDVISMQVDYALIASKNDVLEKVGSEVGSE